MQYAHTDVEKEEKNSHQLVGHPEDSLSRNKSIMLKYTKKSYRICWIIKYVYNKYATLNNSTRSLLVQYTLLTNNWSEDNVHICKDGSILLIN